MNTVGSSGSTGTGSGNSNSNSNSNSGGGGVGGSSASALKVAPTETGACIRVEGKGTMKESYAAQALAERTLRQADDTTVAFDLTACTYLDSTFLGLLIGLHREFERDQRGRYRVAASDLVRRKYLEPMHLDRILSLAATPPATRGDWVTVDPRAGEGEPKEVARHIMNCHRRLAELGGPTQRAFERIADQIERELAEQ